MGLGRDILAYNREPDFKPAQEPVKFSLFLAFSFQGYQQANHANKKSWVVKIFYDIWKMFHSDNAKSKRKETSADI